MIGQAREGGIAPVTAHPFHSETSIINFYLKGEMLMSRERYSLDNVFFLPYKN